GNVAVGGYSLLANTSASRNVAVGDSAMYTQAFSNGGVAYFTDNTAVGSKAMFYNEPTTSANGSKNTGIGSEALYLNTTGQENTGVGTGSLHDNITGSQHTAIGRSSHRLSKSGTHTSYVGYESGYNDSLGFRNTGVGAFVMRSLGSGSNNVAMGYEALYNSTASNNTAIGFVAARTSTTATGILAIGDSSLFSNLGSNNLAIGSRSLRDNTIGASNLAIGRNALESNTQCSQNTAIGESAMATMNFASGILSNNVAIGYRSLFLVNPAAITNSGNQNTAVGTSSGDDVSTGYYNTLMGYLTGNNLSSGARNTFIGHTSGGATTGSENTLLGASTQAGSAINNGTAVGYDASVTQSNSMVFGDANVTKWGFGINTAAANILEFNNAVTTARLTTGGVWTDVSDRNKKTELKAMDGYSVLHKIMQLPVYHYRYSNTTDEYHISPMAQDFQNLFQVGDGKSLSALDKSGVALIGIQQLKKENEELPKELAELKKFVMEKAKME
ncbi:MAG TPA: tail fiber domain-containing protein, partial [Ferruginibacter sp.]|nr:tail fiber domain-containing protein [Ferruginibacter sp.]